MGTDRPPIPAEQEALDRPWRVWASIGIGTFTLVSIVLGFIILPLAESQSGESLFYSICRAIGIPGFQSTPVPERTSGVSTAAAAEPPSQLLWTADTRLLIRSGDRERGAAIVSEVCSGCHGENGMAIDPTFPNLAGQSPSAMFKQLHDYRSGSRKGGQAETMIPFAQALDDQQMADVAAYYTLADTRRLEGAASAVPIHITTLARDGDPARGLASCDSCHGGALVGPEGALILLGQSATYLEQQLQAFASGERDNDLYGRMRDIARRLTPEEIHGLAIYYSGITYAQPQEEAP